MLYTLRVRRFKYSELSLPAKKRAIIDELHYCKNLPYTMLPWYMRNIVNTQKISTSEGFDFLEGVMESYGPSYTESGHFNPLVGV